MSIWTRVGFALATAAIIIGGSVHVVAGGRAGDGKDFDGVFFFLVAVALLPTLVYAFWVRMPRSGVYFGLALLLVTAAAWIFVFVSDDAMRGVFTFPAFFITLVTSSVGAARDHRAMKSDG